jgi:hypothetical protein
MSFSLVVFRLACWSSNPSTVHLMQHVLCTRPHTGKRANTWAHTHTYAHARARMHTHARTHTHAHARTRTHPHTHTRTRAPRSGASGPVGSAASKTRR